MRTRRMVVGLSVILICLFFSQSLIAQEMKSELNKGYGNR
jgi:hypothetical protein